MAKKKKERKIPDVLLFTDINRYQDDLASLVVLAYLADRNLINIRGIVTECGVYEIKRRRAMFAKGAMACLGYPFIRAVPGGDYEIDDETENFYPVNDFTRIFEESGVAVLRSGMTFIQELMKKTKEKNICVLLNAPFPDFIKYVKATMDSVQKKVKKIIVMGDVLPEKNDKGQYLPDMRCTNFKIGAPAAQELFEYAQDKGIQLLVVPRQSIYDLQMKYEFLDAVSNSKNPVAQQLITAKDDSPVSMQYDMLSALAAADGEFKTSGGVFEKEENQENKVFFAKIGDAEALRAKFCEIFKDKLLPKKITLEQLRHKQEEEKTDA